MATLHLLRHGQASFGNENYDTLSARGWEQGRVLGAWLAGKVDPALVVGGSMQRHRETIAALAEGFGAPLPDMQVMAGFNEFDHRQIISRYRPQWADPRVMARDLAAVPTPARAFQQVFVQSLQRWVSGTHDGEYAEPWCQFKRRVLTAFAQLMDRAEGADVLVATSGGPITVVVQHLLALPDSRALALNEVIANTSVTRVLYSGDRSSLAVFNNYSHLEAADASLVTFR
ncbi:histidine phosphatase family protein [Marinobacter sp. X15-166B]|uniref:histidine phosphatase family protein n=1 Tax=Marinobacter sp. X15-166B TaxID=1897620 RepID=UPI00085C96A1|nr:histidine phosphatase family protein [Marinobacter sp. X15-166B]OEY66934.1 phosphoglycerate kinase [Marinobacter sp. X15-166B]